MPQELSANVRDLHVTRNWEFVRITPPPMRIYLIHVIVARRDLLHNNGILYYTYLYTGAFLHALATSFSKTSENCSAK